MTCRLLLVAYAGLAGILPAAGRPLLTVPLCVAVLLATGGLWVRALAGVPSETGLPAIRSGLAAATGLMTFPLVALLLHAVGQPVRPAPMVVGCAVVVTVLGGGALLRERLAARGSACLPGLPAQRRHTAAPPPPSPASPGSPGSGSPGASGASGASGSSASPGSSSASPGSAAAGPPAADVPADPPAGYARTTAAVAIPVVLAVGVGGVAVRAYLDAPHPAEPGYLSVALHGWAAAIDSPVTVPARGLAVPVLVTSAGLDDTTGLLRLRVGGEVVASRPMTVARNSARSLSVYVPALPADGCLRAVDISLGSTSAGFYARALPGAAASRAHSSRAAASRTGASRATASGAAASGAAASGAAASEAAASGSAASGAAVSGAVASRLGRGAAKGRTAC